MAQGTITPVATASVTLTVGTNSYIDVGGATDYITNIDGGAAWLALSADDKARRLISATFRIDGLRLKGYKAEDGQALAFPRKYGSNTMSDQESVPDAVKYAVCEEAVASVNGGRGSLALDGVSEYTIGSLHEKLTGGRRALASDAALRFMKPYLAGAVAVV